MHIWKHFAISLFTGNKSYRQGKYFEGFPLGKTKYLRTVCRKAKHMLLCFDRENLRKIIFWHKTRDNAGDKAMTQVQGPCRRWGQGQDWWRGCTPPWHGWGRDMDMGGGPGGLGAAQGCSGPLQLSSPPSTLTSKSWSHRAVLSSA